MPYFKQFDVHLLALFKNDELKIAKTEWFEIYREHRAEKTGLCICQHTLQHIIYMYNIYTNYIISVGVGCCKKFKIKLNILKRVMSESITKGEYKIINNILEYTTSIELQLLVFLKKESEIDDLKTLKELSINIQELIETYNLTYVIQLKNKINEIEKQRKKIEAEKIERMKIENVECDCGIMKKNMCRCEVPKNIVIFNNLYCKGCEKWKCRC